MKCLKIVVIFVLIQIGGAFTLQASDYKIRYIYQDYKASDIFPNRLLFVFMNNQVLSLKYNDQSQFLFIDFIPYTKYWSNVIIIDTNIGFTASYFIIHLSDKKFVLFDCYNIERFSITGRHGNEVFIEPKKKYLLSFDNEGSIISYAYYFDLDEKDVVISSDNWLNEYFIDRMFTEKMALKITGFYTPISSYLSEKKTIIFSKLKQHLKYYKRLKLG